MKIKILLALAVGLLLGADGKKEAGDQEKL
jgi:hypothetical protein